MNFFSKTGIIALIFIGVISFALITGCISEPKPRLCFYHSSYDLTINVSEPITNVTIYVPLPVKNGTPMVGIMQLDKSQFTKDNFSIDFVQSPPGINLTGAYPVRNSNPWFLKVSASRIDPDPTGAVAYAIDFSNHTYSTTPVIFADTLYPVGNESVFLPKLNFSPPVREQITSRSPEWIEYAPVIIPQKTGVYADYTASPATRLEIHSIISEHNSWVKPLVPYVNNEPIDGGGNDYTDSYSWIWYGESHGGYVVPGELNGFNSVYPDMNHPTWQKMLNETATLSE